MSCRAAVSCIFTLVFIVLAVAGKLAELIVRISACLACMHWCFWRCLQFFFFCFFPLAVAWSNASCCCCCYFSSSCYYFAFVLAAALLVLLLLLCFCCYILARYCSSLRHHLWLLARSLFARLLTLACLAFVLVCLLTRLIACLLACSLTFGIVAVAVTVVVVVAVFILRCVLPARPFRNNVLCCVQPAVRSSFTVEITICTNFTYLNCVWHAPSSPSLSSQLRTRCWPPLVVLAPLGL